MDEEVAAEVLAAAEKMLAALQDAKTFERIAAEDMGPLYESMNRTYDEETSEEYIYTTYIEYDSEITARTFWPAERRGARLLWNLRWR